MRDFLVREWNLQYETHIILCDSWTFNGIQRGLKVVLHDRPPAHFHPATAFETHEVANILPTDILPLTSTFFSSFFAFPLTYLFLFCQRTGYQHPHLLLK